MNIIIYIIEDNKYMSKYILSFNEIEMLEFINSLKNERLEDAHFYPKYCEPNNYTPTTTITSTENLIAYFESIINNKILNLEQLNHLFKEYNNSMYSPATIKKFSQFFNLLTFKEKAQMNLEEYIYFYQKRASQGLDNINDSQLKIGYAFQNQKALDRLGINLEKRYEKYCQETMDKMKTIKKIVT